MQKPGAETSLCLPPPIQGVLILRCLPKYICRDFAPQDATGAPAGATASTVIDCPCLSHGQGHLVFARL